MGLAIKLNRSFTMKTHTHTHGCACMGATSFGEFSWGNTTSIWLLLGYQHRRRSPCAWLLSLVICEVRFSTSISELRGRAVHEDATTHWKNMGRCESMCDMLAMENSTIHDIVHENAHQTPEEGKKESVDV